VTQAIEHGLVTIHLLRIERVVGNVHLNPSLWASDAAAAHFYHNIVLGARAASLQVDDLCR
jgi:hypothetical protein